MFKFPTESTAAHTVADVKSKSIRRPRKSLSVVTILLSQSGDEFLWRNDSDFLLLRGNAVEQVGQTGEEGLLATWLHLERRSGTHLSP